MGGTYLSVAVVVLASAAVGQGLFTLCGRREWSWLSPAVGLGLLVAGCWAAVNVVGPAAGLAALLALPAVLGTIAIAIRAPRENGNVRDRSGLRVALAVLVGALLLASLPFVVEGRFGILGTSLNPDMSQHLYAADRLAAGAEERLVSEGYPLGPHALAVSVTEVGPSLVEAFSGLTVAIAIATALAPLALLGRLAPWRRAAVALLTGLAYMVASYLIQGAFKETLMALLVLAFAIGLHELARGTLGGAAPAARWRLLCGLPLAALAIGSVYAYSFPGLGWLAGGLGLWALAELWARRGLTPLRAAAAPAVIALAALVLAAAPELGRIATFASFETFDPDGAGLGNLFNPISPLETLGIWPSGDFRLDPGAGFAPAAAFWLGALLGAAALTYGVWWWLRRGERAVPAALAAAALLYLYALLAGTPYQEAKAIAIAAPLAMLIAARALLASAPALDALRETGTRALALSALAAAFLVPAAACSALALANGPVGPAEWSPALIELRSSGALGPGGEEGDDTLLLAPEAVLADEHGEDLFLWELRGGKVCVEPLVHDDLPRRPPLGIETIVVWTGPATFQAAPIRQPRPGPDCPFIADGDRAEPG